MFIHCEYEIVSVYVRKSSSNTHKMLNFSTNATPKGSRAQEEPAEKKLISAMVANKNIYVVVLDSPTSRIVMVEKIVIVLHFRRR